MLGLLYQTTRRHNEDANARHNHLCVILFNVSIWTRIFCEDIKQIKIAIAMTDESWYTTENENNSMQQREHQALTLSDTVIYLN
jgi:hypothetical protein